MDQKMTTMKITYEFDTENDAGAHEFFENGLSFYAVIHDLSEWVLARSQDADTARDRAAFLEVARRINWLMIHHDLDKYNICDDE